MKGLLYPIFGLAVVGGYAGLNVAGIDPFAAPTERAMAPPEIRAPAAAGVGTYIGSRSRRRGYRYGK
ncbi:MAG: hypothetical protein AAGE52_21290 [Myxococcota bacterium]